MDFTERATQKADYSMYVWAQGFDFTVGGCDVNKFEQWEESNNPCFTHTWDTPSRRQWLWDTCNHPGREVSRIYLAGVHHHLSAAFHAKSCSGHGVSLVKTTLSEGHAQVLGLKVYALFAVSDLAVSEADLVHHVVWYNDHCAGSDSERVDGVAVNNEAFSHIKNGDQLSRVTYLDKLQMVADNAREQQHGHLDTHYSIGWHWSHRADQQNDVTWHGHTQEVTHHMIDIFDSVDVQVATTYPADVAHRLKMAGYTHAVSRGKPIFATFYTNKALPCQTSFFPSSCHHSHGSSEDDMFRTLDHFSQNGVPFAKLCIHYFRGVYSSGGHPNWPSHRT